MRTFIIAALVFLGSASIASAHAPVLTIDPVGPLEYASFPQAYVVTGTIAHNPLSAIQNLTLRVNGAIESVVALPYPESIATTSSFALPWNITAPGTYTLFVTARHGTTGSTGTSSDVVVEVTQTVVVPPPPEEPPAEEPPIVVTECPAAPSIATHYLKELDVKSGSKLYKNASSLVALHMGPQTDFDGVVACNVAAYATAVREFVDAHLQIAK
jgi:hypothetical protein